MISYRLEGETDDDVNKREERYNVSHDTWAILRQLDRIEALLRQHIRVTVSPDVQAAAVQAVTDAIQKGLRGRK